MDLNPTAEDLAIKEAVRRFCDDRITIDRLRPWENESRGVDDTCWNDVARLGWFGLGLPVSAGGSGLGLSEVACLLEECGRGLVPRPIINAIRSAYAWARVSPQHPQLRALAGGHEVATLALSSASTLRLDDSGVSGTASYVPDAAFAGWHLVAARDAQDQIGIVVVERPEGTATAVRTLDGDRQAHVVYNRTPVVLRLSAAGTGEATLAALRREQSALGLAEMLGAMDAALSMTVAYVKQREQFGQKIAVFQAVQHQVADMATALTASRHLAWQAITGMAAGTNDGVDLPTACAFVGQAAKRVTLKAHHLHGGAGFVVEHPLHYHSERAQALCIRYAPEAAALGEIASLLLD